MPISKESFKWLIKDPVFSKPFTWPKFFRALAMIYSEFCGVALFVSLGCGTLINTNTVPSELSHFNTTLAFVFGIGMAVWITQPISGSVLNPALTLALVILQHFSIYRAIIYMVAQILGATMGVFFHVWVIPDLDSDYCRMRRKDEVHPLVAFLFECISSALLCWGLCGLLDKRRIATARNLSIKFICVLIPIILNMTGLFGSSVNPAVTFGGAIIPMNFHEFWIFFVGPFIGAGIWALIYRFLFDPSIEEKSNTKKMYNVIEEETK